MLREYTAIFKPVIFILDMLMVSVSFYLAYQLVLLRPDTVLLSFSSYLNLLPIILLVWGGLLYFFGIYQTMRIRNQADILEILFRVAALGIIVFGGAVFILQIQHIPRYLIIYTFIISTALIALEKFIIVMSLRFFRKRGLNFRNILIVGSGARAQNFMHEITIHRELGLKILGIIDDDVSLIGKEISGYKVIGAFKDMEGIIHNNVIDEVVFIVPRTWLRKIEEVIKLCELEGIRIHLATDYFNLKLAKAQQTMLFNFPLLTFESTSDKIWNLILKRVLDLLFSLMALIVLAPVMIGITILIKKEGKGPVFFRQERAGLSGRKFILYKFRTMVVDAENRLNELASKNEMTGPVFKMENDPRLTKSGKFLRKYSLDELPQFLNILQGHMSIVGPRPPLPKEVEKYDNWQRRRLSMRPGLTCLWQIQGRSGLVNFEKWMQLDLEYIDNWSLWLDFKIMAKTIPAVLLAVGAK